MHLHDKLQKHFGFKTFLPKQKEVIDHVLSGKDAVVLMPTGGGKSLCYQLPALELEGLTVVVSPLIALMKDQVQGLNGNGIAAAFLNSSLTYEEESAIKSQLEASKTKILYVSPERILANNFLEYLGGLDVKLFAVDEAHCVSNWGHHFRPDYKRLSILKQSFPDVPVIALTATADRTVRSEIGELLKLHEPGFFISSFDRPNLTLSVLPGQKKWNQILKIAKKYSGKSGIIYCSSRASTEKLAERLQESGYSAGCYHAGLDAELRSKTQDAFMQGSLKIVCATIAFGMGIDKADIRFVIHHNMPGNLESYYQEIGRGGRDGLPADCILFYSYRDVITQLGFIEEIDNEQYARILKVKLERMREYAEAQVCRRKILMSYFSEFPVEDCGNCDVCDKPPEYFDGSIQAQMAISAITRAKESIGISTLIDVLKGFNTQAVKERTLDKIKTFGAGGQTTTFAWGLFIQQMIQQGLMEIDYKDHYNLKLTPLSQAVLKGMKIRLVTPETIKKRQDIKKEEIVEEPRPDIVIDESLFDQLRALRKELAAKIRKPAFVVFSDASLRDICARLPSTEEEFLEVHGVGEHKARKYGEAFMGVVREYLIND